MRSPFYSGAGGEAAPPKRAELPPSREEQLERPQDYIADEGLAAAVNVALLLGRPLLLTGEAGTGKTQLAYSLAWELGPGWRVEKFETKSTSRDRELFYKYDAIGRMQARASGLPAEAKQWIDYQALGRAILFTNPPDRYPELLSPTYEHRGPRNTVVLIDEVDKAPRDFPNDILNEVLHMYFRIPELGGTEIHADTGQCRVVLVITSNSEKDLPDAFLRRCVYYDIPFPDIGTEPGRQRLADIVARRLGKYAGGSSQFLDTALEVFAELRKPGAGLRKKPATAELLNWLFTLRELWKDGENPLAEDPRRGIATLSSLIKTAEDQPKAEVVLRRCLKIQGG